MHVFEMGISDITPFVDMSNEEIVQPIVQQQQPISDIDVDILRILDII